MNQMNPCIYLDHHATTPVDKRVYQEMNPFFLHYFGNPSSSSHSYGWDAQETINDARIAFAAAINAHPSEIIFTSGATESSNMAIKGIFMPVASTKRRHAVSSSIEHGATLESLKALDPLGVSTTFVSPQPSGEVSVDAMAAAITDDTALVSIFLVNNEIGTINDVAKIAKVAKAKGALVHCDAAQALGRVSIDCAKLGVDMMSFSGHKIYGPKGVGSLYLSKSIKDQISPLIHGGGQEWYKRSGTLNVPGIVGLAAAAKLAVANLVEENNRIRILRDRLLNNLKCLDGLSVNGTLTKRVAGNLNVSFDGIDGEELILGICNRVAVSTGSACSSGIAGQSKVLSELGVSNSRSQATLRFGVGRSNSETEIDDASQIIIAHIKKQRAKRSVRKLAKIGRK